MTVPRTWPFLSRIGERLSAMIFSVPFRVLKTLWSRGLSSLARARVSSAPSPLPELKEGISAVVLKNLRETEPRRLFLPPARQPFRRIIDEDHPALAIGRDDAVAYRPQGNVEPLFFGGQSFLRPLALGDFLAQIVVDDLQPGSRSPAAIASIRWSRRVDRPSC